MKCDYDILEFATRFRRGFLGAKSSKGCCFMVCSRLVALLRQTGVACDVVDGDVKIGGVITNHYWIKLSGGRVLDPTIDQFRGAAYPELPNVYLGPRLPWIHKPAAVPLKEPEQVNEPQQVMTVVATNFRPLPQPWATKLAVVMMEVAQAKQTNREIFDGGAEHD